MVECGSFDFAQKMPLWQLSEAPMLEEELPKLPIDLQSKNTMVNVAQNKAAIDYCACPARFACPLPHSFPASQLAWGMRRLGKGAKRRGKGGNRREPCARLWPDPLSLLHRL